MEASRRRALGWGSPSCYQTRRRHAGWKFRVAATLCLVVLLYRRSNGGEQPESGVPVSLANIIATVERPTTLPAAQQHRPALSERPPMTLNGNSKPSYFQLHGARAARPYQKRAVQRFFELMEKADEEPDSPVMPWRFTLTCGTGKTFIYGLIIQRDLQQFPGGKHVVFVPWRDLARQTEREFRAFGFRSCVLGDGTNEVGDCDVVVCVYASARRLLLSGLDFRIKLIDEAHHVTDSELAGYAKHIDVIPAQYCGIFSATFRSKDHIEFEYGLDQAVEERFIADINLTFPVLPGNESRVMRIAKIAAQHAWQWSPMFVVFNNRAHGLACADAMTAMGAPAAFLDSNTKRFDRERLKDKLRTGELKALAIVGLFNEGTSINELRTVIFGAMRWSPVNAQQLALRVTRLHSIKQQGDRIYGNVVLPVLDGWTDESFQMVTRAVLNMSNTLRRRVKDRCSRHVSILGSHGGRASFGDLRDAFDALEPCLVEKPRQTDIFAKWVEKLENFVQQTGRLPQEKRSQADSDDEEQALCRWLSRQRIRFMDGSLSESSVSMLEKVPCMPPRIEKWRLLSELPTWEARCAAYASFVSESGGRHPAREGGLERFLSQWMSSALQQELSQEKLEQLLKIDGIRDRLKNAERRRSLQRPDDDVLIEELQGWASRNPGRLPSRLAEDDKERQLGSWLQPLRQRKSMADKNDTTRAAVEAVVGPLWSVWDSRYEEVLAFQADHGGCLPRLTENSSCEDALARWLLRQMRLFGCGRLKEDRASSLRQIQAINASWDTRMAHFLGWLSKNGGRFPDLHSDDRDEQDVAAWLHDNHALYRAGGLKQVDPVRIPSKFAIRTPEAFERWPASVYQQEVDERRIRRLSAMAKKYGGALPRRSKALSPAETRLLNALEKQLREYGEGKMKEDLVNKYLDVPEIASWWDGGHAMMMGWLASNGGRLPEFDSVDGRESLIAKWLSETNNMYSPADQLQGSTAKVPGGAAEEPKEADAGIAHRWEQTVRLEPDFKQKLRAWKHFANWEERRQQLEMWIAENGRLPKKKARDEQEKQLARWLSRLKLKFQQGMLRDHQLQMLQKVPLVDELLDSWHLPACMSWEDRCLLFRQWVENYGELPKSGGKRDEEQLYNQWLWRTRNMLQGDSLRDGQIEMLELVPGMEAKVAKWKWELMSFERRCEALLAWRRKNDMAWPSKRAHDDVHERQLGLFVQQLQASKAKKSLGANQLERLAKIPGMMSKLAGPQGKWTTRCKDLLRWMQDNEERWPAASAHSSEERSLAWWVEQTRGSFKKGRLSESQLSQLNQLPGIEDRLKSWEKRRDDDWEDHYCRLQEWVDIHGKLPMDNLDDDESRLLFCWICQLRVLYSSGQLGEEKMKRLKEVPGMDPIISTFDAPLTLEQRCFELETWVKQHGKLPTVKQERSLYRWINSLKEKYLAGILRRAILEQLQRVPGMIQKFVRWSKDSQQEASWEDRFDQLQLWMMRGSRQALPLEDSSDGVEAGLAKWLKDLAPHCRWGSLTDEQVAQLKGLRGMAERVDEWVKNLWEERCTRLHRWTSIRGALPRTVSNNPEEEFLSEWLAHAQHEYKFHRLNDSEVETLRSIGGMAERMDTWHKLRKKRLKSS
eukprot:TRINITY_DN18329_c0_g1_i3.p1 TRINITY_DN18329_c0_g1~~TRINITY_DN18329_c0_g1_i3.p1  ORF type:complete len:1619 (+),score=391.10 TRINITY_DN18329_c0_g1_i3:78-4934(+)